MYDINSDDSTPVINYEGVSKNVAAVGFQEDGKWMYTGGEDCTARIWDLRYGVCYAVLKSARKSDFGRYLGIF